MVGCSRASRPRCWQWRNAISCTDMGIHRASVHRPAGRWPHEAAASVLTLEFDGRRRRRIRLTTDDGEEILLDLAQTIAMADGDGLQLDDGRWLQVRAAPEPV